MQWIHLFIKLSPTFVLHFRHIPEIWELIKNTRNSSERRWRIVDPQRKSEENNPSNVSPKPRRESRFSITNETCRLILLIRICHTHNKMKIIRWQRVSEGEGWCRPHTYSTLSQIPARANYLHKRWKNEIIVSHIWILMTNKKLLMRNKET